MARARLLQANPETWRVCDWWTQTDGELEHWVVRQGTRAEIGPGDDFAVWVGGREAGVDAIGKVTSDVIEEEIDDDGSWDVVPEGLVPGVHLTTSHHLFDRPIRRADLLTDPDFAQSLVIRMPRTGNPIPRQPAEWRAIRRRVGRTRPAPRADITAPVITHRPIGRVPEDVDVAGPTGNPFRTFPEARLVKAYERWLGRDLETVAVSLPFGERLACDAFNPAARLLIEAKSAATRRDNVRTAIGQFYDYRRFVTPTPQLAVLLPEAPGEDLQQLLRGLHIAVIIRDGDGFATLD